MYLIIQIRCSRRFLYKYENLCLFFESGQKNSKILIIFLKILRNSDKNSYKYNTISSNFLLFRIPFRLLRSWNKSFVPEWNGERSSVWKIFPEHQISCSVPVCSLLLIIICSINQILVNFFSFVYSLVFLNFRVLISRAHQDFVK